MSFWTERIHLTQARPRLKHFHTTQTTCPHNNSTQTKHTSLITPRSTITKSTLISITSTHPLSTDTHSATNSSSELQKNIAHAMYENHSFNNLLNIFCKNSTLNILFLLTKHNTFLWAPRKKLSQPYVHTYVHFCSRVRRYCVNVTLRRATYDTCWITFTQIRIFLHSAVLCCLQAFIRCV